MAGVGQSGGRDEFDEYQWWSRWEWNPRPMPSPRRHVAPLLSSQVSKTSIRPEIGVSSLCDTHKCAASVSRAAHTCGQCQAGSTDG